jgi:hypothetical protein
MAMAKRDLLLAQAITRGIYQNSNPTPPGLLARILNFFRLVTIVLRRYCPELFDHLTSEIWGIDRVDYRQSFSSLDEGHALCAVGDLGYSGSVSAPPDDQLRRLIFASPSFPRLILDFLSSRFRDGPNRTSSRRRC